MNLIALLTDFGLKDNYAGLIKGVILNINPKAQLVDITHEIHSHDICQAAFILYNCFTYFPKGTVFLAVVDPGVGSKRLPIAIKTKNYYFVGPDNGILSLAAGTDGIKKIIALGNKRYFLKNISFTFHARDIFAPISAYIAKGVDIGSFGKSLKQINKFNLPQPEIKNGILSAEIIYIDKFGNLVTNITKEKFLKFTNGKNFVSFLNSKKIERLHSYYAKSQENQPFFIEGSSGFLEISICGKSAKDYFSLKKDYGVRLTIKIA